MMTKRSISQFWWEALELPLFKALTYTFIIGIMFMIIPVNAESFSSDRLILQTECINAVNKSAGHRHKENTKKVLSPSGNLILDISEDEKAIRLSLLSGSETIVHINTLTFITGNEKINDGYKIESILDQSVDKSWEPVNGERTVIRDHYNQVTLKLRNQMNPLAGLVLRCRVYDEGIAFQYEFEVSEIDDIKLYKDLTCFRFEGEGDVWISARAQSEIIKTRSNNLQGAVERPLVLKLSSGSYIAMGEAALVNFARTKFVNLPGNDHSIALQMDGSVDLKVAGSKSPWRYIMVGESPGELLENNYFILNLNEPQKITDTSWIKPGKVIREVTLTTQGGLACVDFAAQHNLQYVEFDAGWYGPEYDSTSDATTVTVDPKRSSGPLELQKVIDYAASKGIGIILYVNHLALEEQLDEILPLYRSWGVKGLKFGFVNVGDQYWTNWLHEAVRRAAEFQLMVDIHDEYRPTGFSRTYPNLMTQEGIRGDEESPSVEQTLNTVFTRMLAGAGDYTNCFTASRVAEKMGGEAAQMAKAIMIFSPWQFLFWYDRPEGSPRKTGGAGSSEGIITEVESLKFYEQLPATWDQIKVLEGEIGQFATIARKKGEDWFIGSLTAEEEHILHLSLNFLDPSSHYEATIYSQDADARKRRKVQIETVRVNHESILEKHLIANSGMAIIVRSLAL